VRLGIFWLVIIALVIFRMEGWEEMESKEVKGKGKNNKEVEKNKTKKQTKKFQREKRRDSVLIKCKLKRHYSNRERIENKKEIEKNKNKNKK
jgi:hypothetical protein